jgi:hypothetical protein
VGFKREKIYNLIFDDPEFDGLEVKARSASIGTIRRVMALSSGAEDGQDTLLEMERVFAKYLVSWNLEDEADQPVPATFEGLDDQDTDLVMALITAWVSAVTGVDDASPLDDSSGSGKPSPEVSIPMEPLSPSLAS